MPFKSENGYYAVINIGSTEYELVLGIEFIIRKCIITILLLLGIMIVAEVAHFWIASDVHICHKLTKKMSCGKIF